MQMQMPTHIYICMYTGTYTLTVFTNTYLHSCSDVYTRIYTVTSSTSLGIAIASPDFPVPQHGDPGPQYQTACREERGNVCRHVAILMSLSVHYTALHYSLTVRARRSCALTDDRPCDPRKILRRASLRHGRRPIDRRDQLQRTVISRRSVPCR